MFCLRSIGYGTGDDCGANSEECFYNKVLLLVTVFNFLLCHPGFGVMIYGFTLFGLRNWRARQVCQRYASPYLSGVKGTVSIATILFDTVYPGKRNILFFSSFLVAGNPSWLLDLDYYLCTPQELSYHSCNICTSKRCRYGVKRNPNILKQGASLCCD